MKSRGLRRRAACWAVLLLSMGCGMPGHSQPMSSGAVAAPSGPAVAPDDTVITPPAAGETMGSVRSQIRQLLSAVQSVKAEVELSREEKKKEKGRRVKAGPLELARQRGARCALTRKDKTEEYVANASILWSYEHKEKEAQYIPTGLPIIRDFVASAMALDIILAMEGDTLRLAGSGTFEGEQCWVIEGTSPDDLELLGVPVVKMRAWISKRDGLPRKISIPKERDTLVLLRHIQVNAPVDGSRFDWKPPKGVKTKNIFGF